MPVFSIGHGGRSPDELTAQLVAHDIGYLLDVRSVPYSRYQPGFSRKPLQAHIDAQAGLRYVYLGSQLGGRPADRALYDGDRVSYARLRVQAAFLDGIDRVITAHAKGLRVCLMCAEAKPWTCHRTLLLGVALAERGVDVDHILPDGALASQTEVMRRAETSQGSLF